MIAVRGLVPVDNEPAGPVLPAPIAGAGEQAMWRFVEFFMVNIRNGNTRVTYRRAATAFQMRKPPAFASGATMT